MVTVIDLGKKVKAKYPQYGDLSDIEVGQKVKAKYPKEYSDFTDIGPEKQKTPAGFEGSRTPEADARSAEQYGAAFPLITGKDNPLQAGLKAAGNLPGSAFNLGKNVVSAGINAFNPDMEKNTVANLAKIGVGGVQKLIPGKQGQEANFDALTSVLKERYGSIDNLARTATNDPFAFGAEVLTALQGGASLIGKGKQLNSALSNVAQKGVIQPVSNLLSKAGDALHLTSSPVQKLTVAIKPSQKIFKDFQEAVPKVIDEIEKAGAKPNNINSLNQAVIKAKGDVWEKVTANIQKGKDITANGGSISDEIKSLVSENQKLMLESPSAVKEIENFANTYKNARLSIPQAEKILEQTNAFLQAVYEKDATIAQVQNLGIKVQINLKLASALRKQIDLVLGSLDPTGALKVGELKKLYGNLSMFGDAVQRRIPVSERLSQFGLGQSFNVPQGASTILKGVVSSNPGEILQGASQVLLSSYMKNISSTDSLISQVFSGPISSGKVMSGLNSVAAPAVISSSAINTLSKK